MKNRQEILLWILFTTVRIARETGLFGWSVLRYETIITSQNLVYLAWYVCWHMISWPDRLWFVWVVCLQKLSLAGFVANEKSTEKSTGNFTVNLFHHRSKSTRNRFVWLECVTLIRNYYNESKSGLPRRNLQNDLKYFGKLYFPPFMSISSK